MYKGSPEYGFYGGRRGLLHWHVAKAYLKGSSLPHAAMACVAIGTAVWFGSVHKWVMEGITFSSLPPAARRRGGRDAKIIYLGSDCQVEEFKCNDS